MIPRRWWTDPLVAAPFARLEIRRAPRVEDLRRWYVGEGWIVPESGMIQPNEGTP
jgi:hypothetical protein